MTGNTREALASDPVGKSMLDAQAFKMIAEIAHREAGLAISPNKAAMVHTRVARRLRALKMNSYAEYCALIDSPAGKEERGALISILTTNVSSFFRESHHFDRMRDEVIPNLMTKARSGRPVRIWSAGCSNGQEPYSIAIALLEDPRFQTALDIKILATDINPDVLEFARTGVYDSSMVSGLSPGRRKRFLAESNDGPTRAWRVKGRARNLISFRQLNLLDAWPMKGKFDVIFCRNVVIYFDQATQRKLWQRFGRIMVDGAWLFLGHSERISEDDLDMLSPVGMTTYRLCAQPDRNHTRERMKVGSSR